MAGKTADKKRKNPWDIPPSGYNKTIFTLNNPFVALRDLEAGNVTLKGDKIGDGKRMDSRVLEIAVDKITKSSFHAAKTYKQPGTEVGGRIVHGALILDLFLVTKKRDAVAVLTPEQLASEAPRYETDAPEDLRDVCVVPAAEAGEAEDGFPTEGVRLSTDSNDSNASIEVRHEGDDPEDNSGDDKTKYDAFKVLAQDKKIKGSDKTVTLLVVECSWETASINKLLQAGAYVTRKDAAQNISKGRFEPIFLESWGKDNWKYAVFFIFGIVKLVNGTVASVNSKTSQAKFSDMLKDSTERLRAHLQDPEAVYPNGDYVHGLVYIPRQDFKLPDVKTEGSGSLPDSDLFFQSLIRIICGDTALTWTVDDLNARIKARKAEVKADQARWRGKRSRE